MQVCLDLKDICTSFETWGFTDRYTWLTKDDGSKKYPLQLDYDYNPKPACDALVQVLTNDSSATCAPSATVPPTPAPAKTWIWITIISVVIVLLLSGLGFAIYKCCKACKGATASKGELAYNEDSTQP